MAEVCSQTTTISNAPLPHIICGSSTVNEWSSAAVSYDQSCLEIVELGSWPNNSHCACSAGYNTYFANAAMLGNPYGTNGLDVNVSALPSDARCADPSK